MDETDRLNLRNILANSSDAKDNTSKIRELQHSDAIRADVETMLKLKKEYARLALSNPQQFDTICTSRCSFLFTNYTDIFNKLKKDEIDLGILSKLLVILKLIETGKLDQHEGSFEVGKLLKQIYVDSALRKSEHLDKKYADKANRAAVTKPAPKNISWEQYKTSHSHPQPKNDKNDNANTNA
jgi:hypothetical protein